MLKTDFSGLPSQVCKAVAVQFGVFLSKEEYKSHNRKACIEITSPSRTCNLKLRQQRIRRIARGQLTAIDRYNTTNETRGLFLLTFTSRGQVQVYPCFFHKTKPIHLRIKGCKSRDTFRNWVYRFASAIANLSEYVIDFTYRFQGWNGRNQCLTVLDGTDVKCTEPVPWGSIWWSHKYNGAGLQYEVATCIAT
jgi:hypothetical protein